MGLNLSNGFPFEISLFSGKLKCKKGYLIVIDSLLIFNELQISRFIVIVF